MARHTQEPMHDDPAEQAAYEATVAELNEARRKADEVQERLRKQETALFTRLLQSAAWYASPWGTGYALRPSRREDNWKLLQLCRTVLNIQSYHDGFTLILDGGCLTARLDDNDFVILLDVYAIDAAVPEFKKWKIDVDLSAVIRAELAEELARLEADIASQTKRAADLRERLVALPPTSTFMQTEETPSC